MTIFNDVFVPWSAYLWMVKPIYHHAGGAFAGYHRQSYGGCKVGVEIPHRSRQAIAEYNGAAKLPTSRTRLLKCAI